MRFAPTPTELLARARADLRMGVPVVLHGVEHGVEGGVEGGALILAV
ncbi:MAG: GTP cyclohydrolase II, partial [Lutimaribacter sp.]